MHFGAKCEHCLNVYICQCLAKCHTEVKRHRDPDREYLSTSNVPRSSTSAKVKLELTLFLSCPLPAVPVQPLKLTLRSVSVFSSRAATLSTGLRAVQPKAEALAWSSFSPSSGSVNDRGFLAFSSLRFLLGGD